MSRKVILEQWNKLLGLFKQDLFWPPGAEERYKERMDQDMMVASRAGTILGLVIFAISALHDWHSQRSSFEELVAARAVIVGIFAILFVAVRKVPQAMPPFYWAYLLCIVATVSAAYLCIILGGYTSTYYAGLTMVVIAAAFSLPFGPARMTIMVSIVTAIYVAMMFAVAEFPILNPALFFSNSYYIASTGGIGIAGTYLADRIRRQSFARFLEIERAQADLRRHDELKSQFFANVSHELRTPLALILGPSESLLKSMDVSKSERHEVELIRKNATVMLKHVNDLLDVARLDARHVSVKYSQVDFVRLLRRATSYFEAMAIDRGVQVEFKVPESLRAECDPRLSERMMMNLLSNAFKHAPRDSKITLTIESSMCPVGGEHIKLKILDQGPGIPPELRERVFERFFKADERSTKYFGGTGLGLAIVKEFAELHGGDVAALGGAGGGAEIVVRLPRFAPVGTPFANDQPGMAAQEVVAALEAIEFEDERMIEPETHVELSSDLPKVLIVEDNREMSRFLENMLSNYFHIETANRGEVALQKAYTYRPDLIMTDIMMPGLNGLELIKKIREDLEFSRTPILVLTAKADEQMRTDLLRSGVQDFLLKPFSVDELVARTVNLVQTKRSKDVLRRELRTNQENIEALSHEMADRQHRLEDTLEELCTTQTKLRKALAIRDEFISLASHELRTPITSLKLRIELLQRKYFSVIEDPERREGFVALAASLQLQVDRLARLVDDMLDLSRINSGRLRMKTKTGSIADVVKNALQNISANQGAKLPVIDVELRDGESPVTWDTDRVEQVLTNLLSNAVKYGKGNTIRLRVESNKDRVKFVVRDDGMGISARDLERIFDRFERAVPAANISGLGLGLYIAKQIVDGHKGTISVCSEVGRYSEFCFELPRHLKSEASVQALPRPLESEGPSLSL